MVRRDLHKESEVDLESETSEIPHTSSCTSQNADPVVSSTLEGRVLPFVVSEGHVCAHTHLLLSSSGDSSPDLAETDHRVWQAIRRLRE